MAGKAGKFTVVKRYPSAERVQDAEGRQYHIGLAPGEVADYVMLVGDPGRAELVRSLFDHTELERRNREYVTFTGIHRGLRVSVMGTGMGPDNTEIACVELCQCAPHPVLLRCGSSGALQADIELGDLVVTRGAYRLENTSLHFVGEGYPAIADHEVLLALLQAADEQSVTHHVGVTATAPGFYGAQARTVPGFPPRYPDLLSDLERQGIKNLEMEISSLLTLGTLRGFRAGAVCAVFASRHRDEFIDSQQKADAELRCVQVGLRALHLVAELDRQRGSRPFWHPGLTAD